MSWRKRPASIVIADADAALTDVVRRGLTQFLRRKYSIDKDAMLKEPDAAKSVAGVTVLQDHEDFVIKTSA